MKQRCDTNRWLLAATVAVAVALAAGCSDQKAPTTTVADARSAAGHEDDCGPGGQLCNFSGGPVEAPVAVAAFYPGRHESTLAAVKSLLDTFPGQVRVEIVDWRTEEGLQRRDATGLVCAGVMINNKNAFDLVVDGTPTKVLFVRGIDGEWTAADLEAAVRQELAAAEGR